MPRTLWNGAISFGLVHIPVSLFPASKDESIDFDWLDKRSMDPVGYKRINKRTGREIDRENIVKGVKVEGGNYVLLSDDEIRAAYPKTTKTIEIEAFVDAADIPFIYLDRPYYLGPQANAAKVYTLLRETLVASGKVGIARVVIQTKQHLAALMPVGPALMLHTLRWNNEVRGVDELDLPSTDKKSALNAGELRMAKLLVDDMSKDWDPSTYSDSFRDAIMTLVDKKQQSGNVEAVEPLEEDVGDQSSNVIDLTALLKRSLGKGGGAKAAPDDDEAGAKPARGSSKAASKSESKPASKSASKSAAKSAGGSTGKPAAKSASAKSTKTANGKTASRAAASAAGPTLASKGASKTVTRAPARKTSTTTTRKRAA